MNPDRSVLHTPLCDLLECDLPILLAGMGGVARAELAAAVAKGGGFPTLGMVREAPDLIETEIKALRAATDCAFAVNLIPAATDPDLLDAQIERCLDLGVRAFSFFWDVVPEAVGRVKSAGCRLIHQVGTIEAARAAVAEGADVLIAQGLEAGGHVHGRTAAFALAARVLAETRLPVVISGGIADGEGLADALDLGAAGVQCGTAFLATVEAFAHDYHKMRIVKSDGSDTLLTDAFVLNWPRGAAVRVLRNSVTDALGEHLLGHDPDALPCEPIAWDEGVPRLRFSTDSPLRTTTGNLEEMALYAGQGAGRIGEVVPAAVRLNRIADEAATLLAQRRSVRNVEKGTA
ncbi:NAD(P)H-dependent flavin oxidoreductase [Acuticoccus kandeliae]|uniref:NAD(P)H-dependent flavin oxidoreductase n=1 Tax=Acuticoccus kandeliae TaxID=2073160 RepID=UPI000D3E1090|nr:nitronate monooxygenase [Acuticoccus kandeliae]